MPTYTLLSGETVEYTADEALADFITRVRVAAADPTVTVTSLTDLLYSEENPLLVPGIIPGRGAVTREVFENPAYHVLLDVLDQKRIQTGHLDIEQAHASYTVSVTDAAAALGISRPAVLQAIKAKRLAAIQKGGQWWIRPESVEGYRVGTRGPKVDRSPTLEVRVGSAHGWSLHLHPAGGELEHTDKIDNVVEGKLATWTRAGVLTKGEQGHARFFEIAPDNAPNELTHGRSLWVRGRFKVVRTENNPERARKAFQLFKRDPEALREEWNEANAPLGHPPGFTKVT